MRVHALVEDLATARAAVAAGATVVQLRVKDTPTAEVVRRGAGFRELGVTFVVDDDVEAAIALGADGVHLGQGDDGAEQARAAGLLLGRSAATLEQAVGAAADYLGVGPVWETPSKLDADPAIGLDGLARICAAVDVPVVAIGGIAAGNAGDCIRAGAAGVAVIRAATDPALRHTGVVACHGGELHAARWVRAADTTAAAALTSDPYPPLGRVVDGHVQPLAAAPPRPPEAPGEPETDVALIKTYPGIEPALLTTAADAGARGIVLEGTGAGNVPVSLFAAIGELTGWGIPVVVASRARTREVALADLRTDANALTAEIGAIGARGLAAPKARVALMVALGADDPRAWFARL